jgi:dihydroneopterin aldolase
MTNFKSDTYIYLHDIHLQAFHGVSEQERKVGNDYCINIRMKVDFKKAASTDDLKETVNYAEVYQIIKEEMAIPSMLMEHVGKRITEHILKAFPAIKAIDLTISKRNPPMGADIKEAGVEIHLSI